MKSFLWPLLAVVIGVMISTQGAINAQLGKLTHSALFASFASFTIGAIALSLPFLFKLSSLPGLEKIAHVPLHLWSGGILGALFVTLAIVIIPQIGITLFVALIILGQLMMGLVLDHFGLFGLPVQEISWFRLSGVALILLGAILARS